MRQIMIDTPTSNAKIFEIRLKGHLEARWVEWFDGLDITLEEDGDTLLTGPVTDQAPAWLTRARAGPLCSRSIRFKPIGQIYKGEMK
jgi:hypothetical protein